ncbi:MAG: potassium channel family protein [Actinomycetota bacterium]|nr:potassium channel family protein [Actinomycetota bacterium]
MTLDVVAVVAGLVVVGLAVVDELHTTIGPAAGPGPLSRLVVSTARRLTARTGSYHRHRSGLLGGPGVVILVATIATWFMLLWLGWGLVFLGGHRAVVSSSTGAPASVADRFYFAGYTLTTLGNGALQPTGLWEWATVGAALSGLALVTLAITFVAPVVAAVVGKRQFASQVHALGSTAEEIALSLHGAGGFAAALHVIPPLSAELAVIVQQHHAYPLLHEFRSAQRSAAVAPAVALLCDAVLVLSRALPPQQRVPLALERSVLSSVAGYLDATPGRSAPVPPPPVPDLADLRAAGLVHLSDAELAECFAAVSELRYGCAQGVVADGYDWCGGRSPAPGSPS